MAGHTAGEPLECYSIPIVLEKEPDIDQHGNPIREPDGKQRYRCGFRIGGGIDQDPSQSPQGYPDKGVYVTYIHDNSPASRCGLQLHDKILQVNGKDFTLVTHKQAVESIRKKPVLKMLVYRKGVPPLQKPPNAMVSHTQFQAYPHHGQPQQYSTQQPQYQPQY
ncbi:Tax1-binding protein 3 [Biomphalaria glabrata]|uniref:Tax1-binding protein 3 homolog n=1 Tax=Biomphalaria glabrata TaxID=6526 RepID=A0A9W3AGL8_BIOGL|nr:tax1-binding protein 3 homolog [Biomphalaria glabrata]KAI8749417.1 tax1-binding protein 3-like protein [Biomphalaria glabrata]KAI8786672.1 tax1-binding protein 3 [Biomphalaria glabrata]